MISEASGGSMSGTLLARCMLQEHSASNLEKDDAPADLALIGAAQRVEHYEMAAYTTARNLAVQMRQPEVGQCLTTSLGEEENEGQLLDQGAQPLISVARMPATVEYGSMKKTGRALVRVPPPAPWASLQLLH